MRKRGFISFLFGALLLVGAAVQAQEIPPVQVGGGQTATRVSNGQTVQVVASGGVSVTVYFNEISAYRVTGTAVRTSGGSSFGTVTIRWVNRNKEVTLSIGPITPERPFGLEGGDVDRNPGQYTP